MCLATACDIFEERAVTETVSPKSLYVKFPIASLLLSSSLLVA